MVRIIDYEQKHHEDFKRLNLEWLEKYNLAESHDLMVLDDPKGTILDRGGAIFIAEEDGKIIGTAALMKEADGVYELAKMSVDPDWRGKGISRMLIEKCLATARLWKARKVRLYSNSQLTAALSLYRKYGFYDIGIEDAPYLTADVRMELILDQ